MSEKKRVRVYKPGGSTAPYVNTDHFANYMFQVGGPVDGEQQAPAIPLPQQQQMPTDNDSEDIVSLLQTYAQVTGMDDQQLQEMYSAIMQMEPDQQQQAITQMKQQLTSSMSANPMVAKDGGYIKTTKKLLNKKVGGVNPNMTSKNAVEQRTQIVKDVIGANMVKDLVDKEAEAKMQQANNMMGLAAQQFAEDTIMPRADYGGYVNSPTTALGYSNVTNNPFYEDLMGRREGMKDAFGNFAAAVGNMTFAPTGGIKVKTRGDIFAEDGGSMPSYQNGSTTGPQNWNQVDDNNNGIPDYLEQVTSNQQSPTSQQTTSGSATGINGWQGGFYWQNGVPVTSIWDIQRQQQPASQNMDWSNIFQQGPGNYRMQGNLMDMMRNPALIKQFGQGLTQFQPEGVYLSSAKSRVNPFGAKVVLKWDYDENGRPVQKEVVEGEESTSGGRDRAYNIMNRIRGIIPRDEERFQQRAERNYQKFYPGSPSDNSVTSEENNAVSNPSATNIPTPNIPMTKTSGSGMESVYEPEITTPNPVYAPVISNPRQTLEDVNEFAYGGMPKARAGRMVIKQQFGPQWDTAGLSITPGMDTLSSILEQRNTYIDPNTGERRVKRQSDLENQVYNTGAFVPPVPMDQLGSRGEWGTASLTGELMQYLQPQNQGIATYQNIPGYELSGQMPYQPMGAYGGTYEHGGLTTDSNDMEEYMEGDTYELDDDQINDIINRGGTVQYF